MAEPFRERVVLAHGCFDLLHLGHIRHLQEAKSMGDRLVVSVTEDAHVSKGLGRPHFTAEQRAEALRGLGCVDQVVISRAADAGEVIARIRPDIYVKGIDYQGDAGEGLAREKSAVAAVGGRIEFTSSEKFSSSRLINSEKFSSDVMQYLDFCKVADFKNKILRAFETADKLKIAFVGEIIIDEYRYVKGLGRSSKEMMLACVETGEEQFEGGTLAASRHAEWPFGECLFLDAFIKKTRYVDNDFNRKLFDVYSSQKVQLSQNQRKVFRELLQEATTNSDVIIALDFGHGLIGEAECQLQSEETFTGPGFA